MQAPPAIPLLCRLTGAVAVRRTPCYTAGSGAVSTSTKCVARWRRASSPPQRTCCSGASI